MFNVSDFFAEAELLIPRPYSIEGVQFEFLALTDDLIQAVKECTTYQAMISLAADSGLAYYDAKDEAKRVVDNEKLAKRIPALWGKEELETESDPCIKYRAGEIVCEISGISQFIADQLDFEAEEAIEKEKARVEQEKKEQAEQMVQVGEHEFPGDTDINNLDAESMAQDALNNANT